MTHFGALVCLDQKVNPGDNVIAALTKALAPFSAGLRVAPYREYLGGRPEDHWAYGELVDDEETVTSMTWRTYIKMATEREQEWLLRDNQRLYFDDNLGRPYEISTSNPNGHWHSWDIGGGWEGHFPVVSGQDQTLAILNKELVHPVGAAPLRCAGGRRYALDLEAMLEAAYQRAEAEYDQWVLACGHAPEIAHPWRYFADLIKAGEMSEDEARQTYFQQPRLKLLREINLDWSPRGEPDPIERFSVSREEYVATRYSAAIPTHALLTKDGQWWDGRLDGDARDEYNIKVNQYVGELGSHDWVVAVDLYHN